MIDRGRKTFQDHNHDNRRFSSSLCLCLAFLLPSFPPLLLPEVTRRTQLKPHSRLDWQFENRTRTFSRIQDTASESTEAVS